MAADPAPAARVMQLTAQCDGGGGGAAQWGGAAAPRAWDDASVLSRAEFYGS